MIIRANYICSKSITTWLATILLHSACWFRRFPSACFNHPYSVGVAADEDFAIFYAKQKERREKSWRKVSQQPQIFTAKTIKGANSGKAFVIHDLTSHVQVHPNLQRVQPPGMKANFKWQLRLEPSKFRAWLCYRWTNHCLGIWISCLASISKKSEFSQRKCQQLFKHYLSPGSSLFRMIGRGLSDLG